MNKIKITIEDGMTPIQEAERISQILRQKLLAGHGRQKDLKRIGDQVDVQHIETQIVVVRKGEKPIELIKCPVCSCDFQNDLFFSVWTNYGGKNRQLKTCSSNCQSGLIEFCGEGRAAKSRLKLKPVKFY